jgi:pimeloyl-ACP methyl ester carboxylesterase
MKRLYINKEQFIAYNEYKSNKKNMPYVIFVHGYKSDMNGSKALYLDEYCQKMDYNFIRFDQLGCGNSSGEFLEQTISSYLNSIEFLIKQLTSEPVILIGSSLGGWLALLMAVKFPELINSLVCLAPAPDFSEELVWDKLTGSAKELIEKNGYVNVPGADCHDALPVSFKFIQDARNHLMLHKTIDITKKVHLIHGMRDGEVPYSTSLRILEKISGNQVVLKLIKDGTHRLSRQEDLEVITSSLNEIVSPLK